MSCCLEGISTLNCYYSRGFSRTDLLPLDGSAIAPETTKKTAKTKKKPSCKTIEQNLSNINVSEADRKCEVRKYALCVIADEFGREVSTVGVYGLTEL